MVRQRSSAAPLAWLYTALIVYASLYPFAPWRVPGVSPLDFLLLPWPRWWTAFDLITNLIGYMPFGALVFVAAVRRGERVTVAVATAFGAGTMLSLAMEFTQNFLPQRVASNLDLAANACGTLIGALLAAWVNQRGGVARWQLVRERWFISGSSGALALLFLWPFGLLVPLPVPLGQGQVLERLRVLLIDAVSGTGLAPWLEGWLDSTTEAAPLAPTLEFGLTVLGLVGPSLVALSIARTGWRRLPLTLSAAAMGAGVTSLSTALNYGPQHLLAWCTAQTLVALGVGCALSALATLLPRRAAAGLGLVALTALVTLVAGAPPDPYFAQSLQGWEQGRFIRFQGAARWVGWLWPYAAIAYLLARLTSRDDPVA
jgi:VanZ family protein